MGRPARVRAAAMCAQRRHPGLFVGGVPAILSNVSINGAQGIDTLRIVNADSVMTPSLLSVEHVSVAAVAASGLSAAGVQTLSVTGGEDFVYTGSLLNSLSYDGGDPTHEFTAVFSGVDGTRDALAVHLSADANLTLNGVENLSLTLGTETSVFVVNDHAVQGDALTVHVDGGAAGAEQMLVLDSVGSARLASFTLDAAAVASDLDVGYFGDLDYVKSITVLTGDGCDCIGVFPLAPDATVVIDSGAGDDCIDLGIGPGSTATVRLGDGDDEFAAMFAVAGSTVMVDGGAGDDFLIAGAGIDIMTGGTGVDVFEFTGGMDSARVQTSTDAGGAVTLTGFDIITDFENVIALDPDPSLTFVEAVNVDDLTAAAAAGTYAGLGVVDADGRVAFETGFLANHTTLQSVLQALNASIGDEGDGVLFSFGGNAYVWAQGDDAANFDDDSLIQLTGVNAKLLKIIPDALDTIGSVIVFA